MFHLRLHVALLLAFGLVLAGCGKKLTEEELYQQAKDLELSGDYNKAEKSYNKLIKDFPQSAKLSEAQAKVELIRLAKDSEREPLLAEIQSRETREDFENAVILYNGLIKRFPKSEKIDEALQKLGLIYLNNREQYQRAVETYERLLADFPESTHAAQAQFMIGYIYANHIKDLERAEQSYLAFKQKYPEHELITSVEWELKHLGKDISEIDIFAGSDDGAASETVPASQGAAKAGSNGKK